MGNKPYGEEYIERLRELYPHHSQREVAKMLGTGKYWVERHARRLGLAHTPETTARLLRKRVEAAAKGVTAESRAAGTAKRQMRRRMDELRILSGEKPRTRYRFRKMSRRAYMARWSLTRRYNYFGDYDAEPYVLCYDEQTRRTPREDYYAQRYGFQFIDAREQNETNDDEQDDDDKDEECAAQA